MYDIIVFENLHFPPSTRKREAGVFGDRKHRLRVDGWLKRKEKNLGFHKDLDTCRRGGYATTEQ